MLLKERIEELKQQVVELEKEAKRPGVKWYELAELLENIECKVNQMYNEIECTMELNVISHG